MRQMTSQIKINLFIAAFLFAIMIILMTCSICAVSYVQIDHGISTNSEILTHLSTYVAMTASPRNP